MNQPEPAADARPVWDPDTSLAGVRKAFADAAEGLGSADPELLPHLLSPLVTTFHVQVERLQGDLERTRSELSRASTEADRGALEAESATIEQKLEAFTQIADSAKEEYERHTGQPWEPPEEDEAPVGMPPAQTLDDDADYDRDAPEAGSAGQDDPAPSAPATPIPF